MPYQDKKGRTCGFLDLETKENSNHFMRRFFLLDYKTHLLLYYMDNPQNLPDSSAPVGQFNMQYVSMVDNGSWSRPKVPFILYINIGREKYFFRAGDAEDRDGWIRALRDASKVVVTTHRTTSQEDMLGMKTQIVGGVAVKAPLDPRCQSDTDSSEDEVDHTVPSPTMVPDSPYSRIPPIKVGYCIKQGALMKNWKRRYFTLDEDGLSYFKSAGDKAPIRTICWSEICEARQSIGIHINKDYVFEVVTPCRVFYVKTETAELRDSWISAINSHHPQKRKVCATESEPGAGASALLRPHPERNTWAPSSPKKYDGPDFYYNRNTWAPSSPKKYNGPDFYYNVRYSTK